jgi:agmatine deiminase
MFKNQQSANSAPKAPRAPHVLGEWASQCAMWTAWPFALEEWPNGALEGARKEISDMIKILSESQKVKLLVNGDEAIKSAHKMVGNDAEIISARYGDVWLRDTGPIFALEEGEKLALRFGNNGWGGKYIMPHDNEVGDTIAKAAGVAARQHNFILEGGALDHNGAGIILTTRQCVLNPNRNPEWNSNEQRAEEALKNALGASRIIWLDNGLMNDHTDGHVDNLARFVSGSTVLCPSAFGDDDPNTALYAKTASELKEYGLNVVQIPSPGLMHGIDGQIVPASHMNFIIGNDVVIVPTYGTASADKACAMIAEFFPDRKVIGLPSNNLLVGGGSFHCITQQEPEL